MEHVLCPCNLRRNWEFECSVQQSQTHLTPETHACYCSSMPATPAKTKSKVIALKVVQKYKLSEQGE